MEEWRTLAATTPYRLGLQVYNQQTTAVKRGRRVAVRLHGGKSNRYKRHALKEICIKK